MERDEYPILSTHQKALTINLDAARYGTFPEIGAGQEVARWFFKVGGVAGYVCQKAHLLWDKNATRKPARSSSKAH